MLTVRLDVPSGRWSSSSSGQFLHALHRALLLTICAVTLLGLTVLVTLKPPSSLPGRDENSADVHAESGRPLGRRILLGKSEDLPKAPPSRMAGNLTWERRLPGALIIGVKKGGTRALLEFLRLHPDVRAPGPEVHFFDRFYHRGLRWYRSQMPASLPEQLTIEKTPSYFITTEVPAKVHAMSSDMKLVVVVRDPVTRAISDYTQAVSKQTSSRSRAQSFEDMVFANATSGLLDTDWSALRIGVYVKFLKKWLRHFQLHQLHFVSGERLVSDPVSELDKVQTFLGLDNLIGEKHFYFNQTKGFPCLKKAEGNGNPHCLGKTKGRTHPTIKKETIQRLADFYRPFNQRFYQMVGRDFGWL